MNDALLANLTGLGKAALESGSGSHVPYLRKSRPEKLKPKKPLSLQESKDLNFIVLGEWRMGEVGLQA